VGGGRILITLADGAPVGAGQEVAVVVD